MKPKKPFMIERGDDFAHVNFITPRQVVVKWVDWDGSKYATQSEAQDVIDAVPELFTGATIIEIIEETRRKVSVK